VAPESHITASLADDAGAAPRRLDPEVLFRPGNVDPYGVLGLWYVRKLFVPTLWIGLVIAIIADPNNSASITLETPEDTWNALLSPLAGIVIAIALRVGANLGALAFALPASAVFGARGDSKRSIGRRLGRLNDRFYVAGALRSLRWTDEAREYAVSRLGPRGALFPHLDRAFVAANVVLPIATIIVSVVVNA
jgi:hypothetical protein